MLTKDEAWRIARNITKLPEFLNVEVASLAYREPSRHGVFSQ